MFPKVKWLTFSSLETSRAAWTKMAASLENRALCMMLAKLIRATSFWSLR